MESASRFFGNGVFHAVGQFEENEKQSALKAAALRNRDECGYRHQDINVDLEVFQIGDGSDESGDPDQKIDKSEEKMGEGRGIERTSECHGEQQGRAASALYREVFAEYPGFPREKRADALLHPRGKKFVEYVRGFHRFIRECIVKI